MTLFLLKEQHKVFEDAGATSRRFPSEAISQQCRCRITNSTDSLRSVNQHRSGLSRAPNADSHVPPALPGVRDIASLLGDFSWEIVDRKIAEEKLRKSEHQLTLAQGIAHIGSWEWDAIADKLTGSNEFNWIFGLILSSYGSFIEMVHPDDRETVNKAFEETLLRQDTYDVQYRIVRPDGFTRVIHARGTALTDAAGRTVRMIGTAQDVTEKREMEEQLEMLNS